MIRLIVVLFMALMFFLGGASGIEYERKRQNALIAEDNAKTISFFGVQSCGRPQFAATVTGDGVIHPLSAAEVMKHLDEMIATVNSLPDSHVGVVTAPCHEIGT